MDVLSEEQELQEAEYIFPYHYLLQRHLHTGIHYFSYVDKIIQLLKKQGITRKVHDVGCGDGRITMELSKHFMEVTGSDYSKRAIAFAQAFSPEIKFTVVDLTKNKIADIYDAIVCIEVIEHINPEALKRFMKNTINMVKKGGVIVITTPTKNMPLPEKHYQHFTKEKIDELLGEMCECVYVGYHSKRFFNKVFVVLRAFLYTRWFSCNIQFLNVSLFRFYKIFVETASANTGERIIYVAKRV